MDIKRIYSFQVVATIFTIVLGSILHFTYDLLGNSNIVATFSAVNESTWEHLKLLAIPMILFAIVEYFFIGKDANNYIEAKVLGIIFGMILITTIFYTYTGIIGNNFFLFDIATFIIAVIGAEWLSFKIMTSPSFSNKITQILSLICAMLIIIMFFVYTFIPPEINLFRDPITGNYGIPLNNRI